MADPLVRFVTSRLEAAADPRKAEPMQTYMKTDMPFFGVQKPERVKIVRAARAAHRPASADQWQDQVLGLWALEHREQKYCALDWLLSYPQYLQYERIDLLERLIREGAWWDLVDPVATSAVGQVVQNDRWLMRPVLLRWLVDDDLWLRRSVVICQVKHGTNTDEELLLRACATQLGDPTFWLRKAIGWALREYSKVRPDTVRAFLSRHGDQVSGLTRREASRYLDQGNATPG